MADKKTVYRKGELVKTVQSEDGKHYRHFSQDLRPVMDRVTYLNEKVNGATRAENRNGYHYLGSVPITVITDWLEQHNYTLNEFATNAGGDRRRTDPTGPGVKDKFLRYFMSRDFSKLHTQHVTTKRPDSGLIYLGG